MTPINLIPPEVRAEEKKVIAYGLSHLLLLIVSCLLLCGCFYLYNSRRAESAEMRAAAAQAKAQISDQQNQSLQQATTQQIAALAEQNKNLQAEIENLGSAITSRDVELAQRQQQIVSLPPSALAQQWGAAAQEPAPALDGQGNFLASLPLAQKSLNALISLTALENDKQDLISQVQDSRKLITNDEQALAKEQAAHLSDVQACTADKAALQATIKEVKADARRSKFKWTLGGFISGFIAGISKAI